MLYAWNVRVLKIFIFKVYESVFFSFLKDSAKYHSNI